MDGCVFGGPERDRTADLLVANEALSQLSYRPLVVLPAAGARGVLLRRCDAENESKCSRKGKPAQT
jgi:hypothetical protein